MNKQITYNLSTIQGFQNVLKNEEIEINEELEKYYTIKEYYTKANEKYTIIKYKKEFLGQDLLSSYGLLRSVILSGKQVVSFSPPKALSGENFMLKYPTKTDYIVAEEFIEGTMINLFFDQNYGHWQISTRNTVGAEVSFYKTSNLTFDQMFVEACISNNFNIQTLNPKYCYSFVLQHPSNRIVVPFRKPQLYLVAVYDITQSDYDVNVVEEMFQNVINGGLWHLTGVRFPEKYEFSSYTELIDKFASRNTPYDVMGIIVKNIQTGERTKFRNPIYEEVRQLRGNQSKLQYQYLTLRHSGKLSEFLKYYPETKQQMSMFRDQVHMFTHTLHINYISCYVKKEKPLIEFSTQFRTHMFKIHEYYINELRPQRFYVTNSEVIKYVNNLHPSLLMYCLNYNMKKRMIDTIKADQYCNL